MAQARYQVPASKCEMRQVVGMRFQIFRADQIRSYAACKVTEAKSYFDNKPVRGGLSDLRMGSTDFAHACETCHMKHPDCPGHFGYIELAEPMFNVGVFDFTVQTLRSVCKTCSALLIPPNHPELQSIMLRTQGNVRLGEVSRLCTNLKKCGLQDKVGEGTVGSGCGAEQMKVGKVQGIYPGLAVKAVNLQTLKEELWTPEKILEILDRISDDDARILGFKPEYCHPRDLLLQAFPIPPPQVRPTVSFGTARSDDELTHKLMDVLKVNMKLEKDKAQGVSSQQLNDTRQVLQQHVATYFHNGTTYYKTSKLTNGKPLKSIAERLKGKYGRLRGNLMGKRVDFSARTVITGDPTLDVDEVGVPISVAMTLTFPERVNAINKKRLTSMVRSTKYPGANYIIQTNGVMKRLAMMKNREELNLKVGDIVERHILSRDVVLFNRQPTLHRMSMMGHRVRVLPFNTFRLNLSVTTPYNADFDGDEMNLHVPQSLMTKAELQEMMMVPKNFVSPNKSAPCMGIVQDSLLGVYKITDRETFLDKYFMQNLAMWTDRWDLPIPAILRPEALWTGKQIVSFAFPEMSHTHAPDAVKKEAKCDTYFSAEDRAIIIRRGQLVAGIVDKPLVGASPGSLIHVIFNEKGSDEVLKFINNIQRITAYFLINASFGVGVQDTVADEATLADIDTIVEKSHKEVRMIAAKANNGELKRQPGKTLLESFENMVNRCLNKCREDAAQRALKAISRNNNFKMMATCGSKGSDMNFCQIAVMVGQQNVNGKRIPFGFRRRTLPHFEQDDYGETSRGMVRNGYLKGLDPQEFFFHTMGGREGLIDTACKTADTGYLQRKLIKALEDVQACYDGSVRNGKMELVQLTYGEDNLDGMRIELGQVVDIINRNDKAMKDTYRFEYTPDGTVTDDLGGDYMTREAKKALRADPNNFQVLEREYRQLLKDRDNCRSWLNGVAKTALPVNITRLIRNAQSLFSVGRKSQLCSINPTDVVHQVEQLQQDLKRFFPAYGRTEFNGVNIHNKNRVDKALMLFSAHLRAMLASKRVIKEHRLNEKAFQFLLGEIRLKYMQAMIAPGEMVGAIAAQSCGEPATQMTLNTFHHAGISSKNVTLGVPRLKELLNVSRSQKMSNMVIHLKRDWQTEEKAGDARAQIEYTTVASLTKAWYIWHDPKVNDTVVEEDREIVEYEWDLEIMDPEEKEPRERLMETMSPWVVRVELNKAEVDVKSISLYEVKQLIETTAPNKYFIEHSQDNAERIIMRLRLISDAEEDPVTYLKTTIPVLFEKVHVRGIPGIKKVFSNELGVYEVDETTGEGKSRKRWVLETEGTALKKVLAHDIVDGNRTDTNNIPEIYRVMGIEAARMKLFQEMRAVYLGYSLVINYRHYSILVDVMCQRGYLMAVSRVGINKAEAGPLMRCSFEETVKILMQAAAFSEYDPIRGVSSNLVLGNQAKVGTGLFDLMLNNDLLRHAVDQEAAVSNTGSTANVYHTQSSMVAPQASAMHMGTPLMAQDFSVHVRGMDDDASASMAKVEPSAIRSEMPMYTPQPGGEYSAQHSAPYSMQFAPQSQSMAPYSEMSMEPSSMMNLQSSEYSPYIQQSAMHPPDDAGHATSVNYQPGISNTSYSNVEYDSAPSGSDAQPYSMSGPQGMSGVSPSYVPMTSPSYMPHSQSHQDSMQPSATSFQSGFTNLTTNVSQSYIPDSPAFTPAYTPHHSAAQDPVPAVPNPPDEDDDEAQK